MAINVTTAFKNAMKAPVKTVSATVAVIDGDTYTSADSLVKCELQANGYYFGVATKSVSITLLGTSYDLVDEKFELTLKVLTDSSNNTWADCILGCFKVAEQTVDLEKEMTTIKAYDAIGIIGNKNYKEGDFTFPVTVNALAERLAIDAGMDVGELDLVNGTYQIPEDLYSKINNITHRDILAEIAGASASLASVHGLNSELTFTNPKQTADETWTYDNLKKIKIEPKYGVVNSVVIARTPQEDNIAVRDEDSITLNGLTEVKLANNEILDDNREAMATPILNAVDGFGFSPFQATTEGHGWHEIGDRIKVLTNEPRLPSAYQEVEYIQSVGIRKYFVDTLQLTNNSSIEVDCVVENASTGYGGLWCCRQSNYSQTNTTFIQTNDDIRDDYGGNDTTHFNGAYQNRHVFKRVKNKFYVDDTLVKTNGTPTFNSGTNVTTFLCANSGTASSGIDHFAQGKFYSIKVWEGDELVRNFVPCYRVSDSVVGLYELVNGVFYTNAGTGTFTAGDAVNLVAEVIVTDIKLTIDGGIKEEIKGVAPDTTTTDYALAGGIKKTIYNTEIKVDKQGQEITSVVSRQDQFENETLENFTQVVQNINSITTTIQTTGGGNLIHNSVGYNIDSNRNLVNWTSTGTVSADSSPESVSYGALSGNQINLSASSSITQRIAVDTQGSVYSFSFKAKKGATGTATVHLRNSVDDYSITLPANESVLWQGYNLNNLTPHDSYFDVVVETNNNITDFAITDIILNVGDSNTPWVPASDEILSKSVAIDGSGVTVRSNTNDDYVKLDEFGLNGYHGQTNVFKLQQDVTEVAKLKARNQIEMPPIKIVPITSGSRAGWCFVKEEN